MCSAEQHALRDQQREPGAEQFLLAALDLPDGTAREAFELTHNPLLGAHVVAVVAAMKYGVAARALRAMGIDADRLQAAADEIAGNHVAIA